MPIETTCQTCACRLRVADEHAGRQARCPQCGSVYPVPARPSPPQPTVPPAYRRPHRGRLVLTLGLLGWLICPLFAAWACSMGWTDLRAMREGTMDPEGQSLTQAGLTLGLIEIAVFVSAFALFFAGVLR